MRNTLTDLNNYLFETLERLTDDELTEEQLQKESPGARPLRRWLKQSSTMASCR